MLRYECPECGSARSVPDDMAGRKIRCQDCQTPGFVESRNGKVVLLIVGIVGAALLLLVSCVTLPFLVGGYMRFSSPPATPKPVAAAPKPEVLAPPPPPPAPKPVVPAVPVAAPAVPAPKPARPRPPAPARPPTQQEAIAAVNAQRAAHGALRPVQPHPAATKAAEGYAQAIAAQRSAGPSLNGRSAGQWLDAANYPILRCNWFVSRSQQPPKATDLVRSWVVSGYDGVGLAGSEVGRVLVGPSLFDGPLRHAGFASVRGADGLYYHVLFIAIPDPDFNSPRLPPPVTKR